MQVHGVSLNRGGRTVVNDVSAPLHAGSWVAVIGPNGAGKSSLLSMMAGLVNADKGYVTLADKALANWSGSERAKRLAWLAQQGEAEGDIAVKDVVALGRLPHHGLFGAPDDGDIKAITAAMKETECWEFGSRRLGELSGGERQRVLLARALAVESDVLLLDEPTAHLDAPHQSSLIRTISNRVDSGAAAAVVLHDLTLALTADRVWLMDKGRLLINSAPDNLELHTALIDVFDGAIAVEKLERDGFIHHLVRPII